MIALCPQCKTRYRLAREKVGPQGVRIRCSKCKTVFRVQAPKPAEPAAESSAPAERSAAPPAERSAALPAERSAAPSAERSAAPPPQRSAAPPAGKFVDRAVVAEADPDVAKRITDTLNRWQVEVEVVTDGGQALLRLFRKPPDLAILGGHLPGMTAPVITEIARRAESLRIIPLVRIAPMDEPAGAPEFEANEVLEPGEVGERLGAVLRRLAVGRSPSPEVDTAKLPVELPQQPSPAESATALPPPTPDAVPPPQVAAPEPVQPGPADAEPDLPQPAARKSRRQANASTSDDPAIVSAERLARIAVSDIILYNEEKFAKGVSEGNAVASLEPELAEARHLFEQRIPEETRNLRDFLVEELERRVAAKSA